MENFGSQGTQSSLICKNQLCHDFSIVNPILNFVEKYSLKLKTRNEPRHCVNYKKPKENKQLTGGHRKSK